MAKLKVLAAEDGLLVTYWRAVSKW